MRKKLKIARIVVIDWIAQRVPYLAYRWGLTGIVGAICDNGRTLAANMAIEDVRKGR
jgi:hypothetical protein